MRLKDLLNVIQHTELYVYAIEGNDYKTLAMPSVDRAFDKYSEECEKIRNLIKSDEYSVRRITMVDRNDGSSFISIECIKD